MSHHLTCPHCESALRVPERTPAEQVRCPRCSSLMPHPDSALDPVGVARRTVMAVALDDEPLAQPTQSAYLGIAMLLATLGGFALAGWVAYRLDNPIVFFLLGLLFGVFGLVGLLLVNKAVPLPRRIGWSILAPFAFIGALVVCGCLIGVILGLLQIVLFAVLGG